MAKVARGGEFASGTIVDGREIAYVLLVKAREQDVSMESQCSRLRESDNGCGRCNMIRNSPSTWHLEEL